MATLRKKQEAPGIGLRKKLPDPGSIVDSLQAVLETWETKEYASDRERWQSYTQDIATIIQEAGGAQPTMAEEPQEPPMEGSY